MRYRQRVPLIAMSFLLASCANRVWVRSGATQDEFAQDRSVCDYQSELATPDTSVYYHPRTVSDGVADGIVSGFADGMRKATLMNKCMISHGWELQTVEPAAHDDPTTTGKPTDPWSAGYAAGVADAHCGEGHSDLWMQGCKAAVKSVHSADAH